MAAARHRQKAPLEGTVADERTPCQHRAVVGRVASVNVSKGGVPKLPIERAWVGALGLDADGHVSPMHGGPDRAVSLYCLEALARVAADGNTAFPGAYGENLTIAGIDWSELQHGDRLTIGDDGLEIELTSYAAPCTKLAQWFVDERFVRISPLVHPEDSRWYARVLSEGAVTTGDRVELVRSEVSRSEVSRSA